MTDPLAIPESPALPPLTAQQARLLWLVRARGKNWHWQPEDVFHDTKMMAVCRELVDAGYLRHHHSGTVSRVSMTREALGAANNLQRILCMCCGMIAGDESPCPACLNERPLT
jgi:hypothetical protein